MNVKFALVCSRRVTALHCPECSFANSEGASYCQKCGAFIGDPGESQRESTATYRIDQESGELIPVDVKAGDTVVYSKYGGTEITVDGEDVLILNARDVLAVIK